jgi:ubiquitin carboxyl-terminal hydrolase 25/28
VNNTNDSHLVNIRRYTLLGVLPNQPKEIVVNAYKRQWELLPNKRKELIDALMGIANDLNDEQLADYAATQSSVFDSQLPTQSSSDDDGVVSQALAFLGLQPPNKYNAETLVAAFRQKLSQEPKMANSARQMLLLIAQASTDDTYQAILLMEANGKMSVATAKAVLGMKEDSSLGPEVVAATRTKVNPKVDMIPEIWI